MSSVAQSRQIPLTKWNEYHLFPPVGGLRHLVFNAPANGFDKVIRRVGRRILIDEASYFAWVEEQSTQPMVSASRKPKPLKKIVQNGKPLPTEPSPEPLQRIKPSITN